MKNTQEYVVRNDITGEVWRAGPLEASYYAIGGIKDAEYSVFLAGGSATPLLIYDIV